ncbi:MAG: DUF1553 domain-containing protein [Verrucomicrobiales bacterium]|nr:DUF1553 domain-containing protein [Verrucomicrobiales bacterium]
MTGKLRRLMVKLMQEYPAGNWLTAMAVSALLAGTGSSSEDREPSFHFAHDIAPVLARLGCSAAECHGGATGKGGFKLSLFSSNPEADFAAITQEFESRRVDYVSPGRSLFLRKPTRDSGLKHGGGRVLKTKDPAFEALKNWIASGTPWETGEPLELTSLRLKLVENRARVTADFETESGEIIERDVTEMTMLESTNGGVASITESGEINIEGPGEAWILARYGHLNARLPVLSSFGKKSNSPKKSEHPLDRAWLSRLEKLGLPAAESASDAVLRRRLTIDLLGRPPGPLEVGKPVDVDAAFQSGEFAETWAKHVASWFEVPISERDPRNSSEAHTALRAFFQKSVAEGDSIAQIASRILLENSPGRAWKRFSDPRDRAEFVGRSMLGIRLGCARCHNHPLDRWKQDEHLAFSAFFSDDRPNPNGGAMMMTGQFFEPETGNLIEPALLPLPAGNAPDTASRKDVLAWFILKNPKHDLFARNIANRTFAALFGQPLVDSPDDHRLSNPAVHEPVLDLLTNTLIEVDYDLRELIRFIVTSDFYKLASSPNSDRHQKLGDAPKKYMAHQTARRLSADEFRRAVGFVTGVKVNHPLPPESPLAEQLYVLNSGLIQKALTTPGNQVDAIFDFGFDPAQQLEDLYRLILSRPPTDEEKAAFLPELKDAKDPRQRGRDLAFALLASREFGSVR